MEMEIEIANLTPSIYVCAHTRTRGHPRVVEPFHFWRVLKYFHFHLKTENIMVFRIINCYIFQPNYLYV